jgi:malonyl-CoA O-methyltransferase
MVINLIDQKIRRAFSDAALQYDMLTSLHKEIGRELTKKVLHCEPCERILDIGMGTAWFTNRLTNIFPEAMVIGIDSASGMITRARDKQGAFRIVQADAARLPFKGGTFDIITSNLAYQWVGDLAQAMAQCRFQLTGDGTLCFTMFGYNMFRELFEALEQCTGETNKERDFSFFRLANEEQVAHALHEAGFQSVRVDAERIKVRFEDMISLVKWVKDIGANALPNDIYIGKDLLLRTNEYYNAHYRDRLGVYATFEVIWVYAKR